MAGGLKPPCRSRIHPAIGLTTSPTCRTTDTSGSYEMGGPQPYPAIGGLPLQVGEVLLPELQRPALVPGLLRLGLAQLHPADLARDGLGQVGELQAADALVGGQPLPGEGEDVPGELGAGLMAGGGNDIGLDR